MFTDISRHKIAENWLNKHSICQYSRFQNRKSTMEAKYQDTQTENKNGSKISFRVTNHTCRYYIDSVQDYM